MSHRTECCLNCGEPTPGNFCPSCGQRNADYRVSFRELWGDALDGLFQIDSRIARTLLPFLFRPGFLTREYNAGRRTRYSSPLRIYLLLSVAYFFALSLLQLNTPLQLGTAQGGDKGHGESKVEATPPGKSDGKGDGKGEDDVSDLPKINLGWRPLEQHAERQIKMLQKLDPQEATRRLKDVFLSQVSKALFFVLPLFAMLLKLLYLRSRRFYIEHLTFALHLHAFLFFLLLLCLLQPARDHLGLMALLGYTHLVVALRTVYGQSWLRTLIKSTLLLLLYTFVLLTALVGLAVLILLTV